MHRYFEFFVGNIIAAKVIEFLLQQIKILNSFDIYEKQPCFVDYCIFSIRIQISSQFRTFITIILNDNKKNVQ